MGRTWPDIVALLPVRVLGWAAALALMAFAILVGLTTYGFFTHQVLKVAGWAFGQEQEIEMQRQSATLRNFAEHTEKIFLDSARGLCFKFQEDTFTYCFDRVSGNFVSYNYNNTPWRGLGKSPQNTDAR